MSRNRFSSIQKSLKTSEVLNNQNPELKKTLNEGLKKSIVDALKADDELSKAIHRLDLDAEALKKRPLDKVIEEIKEKVDSKHANTIGEFLSKAKDEIAIPNVEEIIGLDIPVTENPLLKEALLLQSATEFAQAIKIKDLNIEKEITPLLTSSHDRKMLLLQQLKVEKNWSSNEYTKLENIIDLMRVADNQVEIVSALAQNGVEKPLDLIYHDSSSLTKLLQLSKIKVENESQLTDFAAEMLLTVEKEYPSAYFLHRLVEKPSWIGLEAEDRPKISNTFTTFYQQNRTFDLVNEPIISLETGLLNTKIKGVNASPDFIKELSLAQQALQISPDTTIAALLMAKNVNIYKAVNTTHNTLMRELSIDAATAIQIKNKAQSFHETAMNGFLAYRDLHSNPFITNTLGNLGTLKESIKNGLGNNINWDKIKNANGLKELNSIEDLFGSQDFCECDHCQSVLSPAAYFVDLMRFIEQRVLKSNKTANGITESLLEETHPIHLKVRRPDLWELPLTCENTNKRIPYIEIVNEVLSAFIQNQLGRQKSINQRLLEENPLFEFSLPYNVALEEVRTWFNYLKTSRLELLEFLYTQNNTDEKLEIALERLNLSSETYQLIIDQNLQASIDKNVLEFRRRSGLSPEQTEIFTELRFWNNELKIQQIKDVSDIQKSRLEFNSSAPSWEGKAHRLIRLWTASGWSLTELDIVLQTFNINHTRLNTNAISDLALFREIQTKTNLSVETIAGILRGITTIQTRGKMLTLERLLPFDWVNARSSSLEELREGVDEDAVKLLLELQGIFGVNTQDMLDCLGFLESDSTNSILFDSSALDTIFRYIQLYKWSKADSFGDFVQLLEIWEDDRSVILNLTPQRILSFIDFLNGIPLKSEDLIYLLGNSLRVSSVVAEDVETLDSEALQEVIHRESFLESGAFETLFNQWMGIERSMLAYFFNFIEINELELLEIFRDLQETQIKDQTYIALSTIKNKIDRLSFIFEHFKIDSDSIGRMAALAGNYNIFKLGFTQWQDSNWIKSIEILGSYIRQTKSLNNFDLFALLANLDPNNTLTVTEQRSLARWQKVTLGQVQSVITSTDSIIEFNSMLKRLDWMKVLNMNEVGLRKLTSTTPFRNQSRLLQQAIRSKFADNETWEKSIQDHKNQLSSKLRDALCNFIIFNQGIRNKQFGFKDRESLYEYFLLDVGMGDCFTLPKIVVATNSLQVYIQRCIMGLERSSDERVSILLDLDEIQEWEWRKNYRVWEANRKIFLFPENYTEAEIRDNKSPEFKILEDELLQQKLTSEVVENAYKKYLEQVMTLAELRIAGAHYDRPSNRIYIFGKTNHQPTEFYFRHLEFLESGGLLWSNWEKMNISIPSQDISAIVYNGKLHIFWTTFLRKDISRIKASKSDIFGYTYDVFLNYSYLKVDNRWSPPQKIEIAHRSNSPYDAFLRMDEFKGEKFVARPYQLTENGEKARENVLKAFETTVYRKPYPLYHKDKKNLNFGFIYTDKEDALREVYKHTIVSLDSFSISVRIEIDYLIAKIEQNLEFSFNRIEKIIVASSIEAARSNNFNIPSITFSFSLGSEMLDFRMEFSNKNNRGFKFTLHTLDSSGNKIFRFKQNNREVKSGDIEVFHQVDYVPISKIDFVTENIDMVNQSLIRERKLSGVSSNLSGILGSLGSFIGAGINFSFFNRSNYLEPEYNTYFDNFNNFHVTDGSTEFTNESKAVKIQQKNMSSVLITPNIKDNNEGYPLNPEHIQLLWEKISLGLDDLMDTLSSQRHVQNQIDYSQSFGNYFYELFFHIPMRIADHLNTAGRYQEANQWYSYIYNPTAIKDKFEQLAFPKDVNWRFIAFRNLSLEKLKDMYSNPDTIEMYRRNPGNPHAIARLRIGAYQKHVVMKYLDNLMDWADNLFEQFTPESTSEARYLYSVVKTILGNKPQSLGKCKDTGPHTYSKIQNSAANEFIYNIFSFQRTENDKRKKLNQVWQNKSFETLVGTDRMESVINSFQLRTFGTGVTKYSAKSLSPISVGVNKPVSKSAKTTIGISKIQNIQSLSVGSRFSSIKPHRDILRPSLPLPLFNLEKDLVFCFPPNKDFANYWERVDDRIYKLNHCLDINGIKKEMPAFAPPIDPMLLARMVAGGLSFDEIAGALNNKLPQHRFRYLLDKARQYTNIVQSFGQALFSAIEKKDAQELILLRSRQEQNILQLSSQVKKKAIEQAKINLQTLLETKAGIEFQKSYYENLIETDLIPWERTEQVSKYISGTIKGGEAISKLMAAMMSLMPDVGSPFSMKYGGTQLSSNSDYLGEVMSATSKLAENIATMAGMEAKNKRREKGWQYQVITSSQELVKIYEQIRNAEIALQVAEIDLEIHESKIEQYKELYDFYMNKFSGFNHYTFQVRQMQQLYRMAFNLAQEASLQAQRAFEFERFGTEFKSDFVKNDNWNNERLGLLAGERLNLQLMQLEQEFINTDKRKVEITQHFSMLQLAPEKLLELKIHGECANFEIPEAAFDLVYPGYFRRIIKSVRLTILCNVGKYTNVGATLSLGTNKIRANVNEGLKNYNFTGCQTIATSSAENDGGQFDLNFKDDKYLPFEGAGAISSWTLSLPKNLRPFDYNSIADIIFHINYTADYDGIFKENVETSLATELNTLNGSGLVRVFSMLHDFSDTWNQLNDSSNNSDVILELRKEHFPYFANVADFDTILPKVYSLTSDNNWVEDASNLGISKNSRMRVRIPAGIKDYGYSDLLFLVKYSC